VGDPAGIGPEITVKALGNPEVQRSVRAVVIADRAVLERTLDALGLDVELHAVIDPEEGGYTAGVIDFVDAGVLRQLPA
jgi:4-hydroxythreonine-4-phosphate dehydrogenase